MPTDTTEPYPASTAEARIEHVRRQLRERVGALENASDEAERQEALDDIRAYPKRVRVCFEVGPEFHERGDLTWHETFLVASNDLGPTGFKVDLPTPDSLPPARIVGELGRDRKPKYATLQVGQVAPNELSIDDRFWIYSHPGDELRAYLRAFVSHFDFGG